MINTRRISLLIISLAFLSSCFDRQQTELNRIMSEPARHFENLPDLTGRPLESRVTGLSPLQLKYLREMDGRQDYEAYSPSPEENRLVAETLKKMPAGIRRSAEAALAGVHLVKPFLGSGMCDWSVTTNGRMYCHIYINAEILDMNISQWLTWKENTAFSNDDWQVYVDCGTNETGIYGILLHELAHLADYTERITPYVEYGSRLWNNSRGLLSFSGGLTDQVWAGYAEPLPRFDSPFRKKVTFYGFSQGPRLGYPEADRLYQWLERTPFASIYGSLNWAEDLAEGLLYYDLTEARGRPYYITVYSNTNLAGRYAPFRSPYARERFWFFKRFYEEAVFSRAP